MLNVFQKIPELFCTMHYITVVTTNKTNVLSINQSKTASAFCICIYLFAIYFLNYLMASLQLPRQQCAYPRKWQAFASPSISFSSWLSIRQVSQKGTAWLNWPRLEWQFPAHASRQPIRSQIIQILFQLCLHQESQSKTDQLQQIFQLLRRQESQSESRTTMNFNSACAQRANQKAAHLDV